MAGNEVVVEVFVEDKDDSVAKIALNGYNIAAGGTFGHSGAMRSFKVVEGEVFDFWQNQTRLRFTEPGGEDRFLRIFAAPVDTNSSGFVEFL